MITGFFSFSNSKWGSVDHNWPHKFKSLRDRKLAGIAYANSAFWENENGALIQQDQSLLNQEYSGGLSNQVFHDQSGLSIVAWARIDNRLELKQNLSQYRHDIGTSDKALILASFLKWGEQCCEHLIGDYVFAIYDARNKCCFLGRDHTGAKPLYYYSDNNGLMFASAIAVFKQVSGLNLELNEEWLSRYVIKRSADWEQTVYRNIKKVPPAHCIKVSLANGDIKKICYFEFSHTSNLILANDDEYVEAYKEVLTEAVRCRTLDAGLIGTETSGGLDSSTITAIAARCIPNASTRLHGFGIADYEQEPDCIMAVSQSSPIAMTHLTTRTQGNHTPEKYFYESHGGPEEHSNGRGHSPFYTSCQALGINVLLSGFGGDEFVTSAAPTALVEFWREHQFRLFISRQRGNILTKPAHTLRWLYHYYRHNNQSITSRRIQQAGAIAWPQMPLDDGIIEKYSLNEKYHKPLRYDGGQLSQNGFALNNRWSAMMTARYENCTLMAARYGVDYRWPLMDVRLLKLFLSIPASQKLGPRLMGRYLHRRAVENILPDHIAWKSKDMVSLNPLKKIFFGDRYLHSLAKPKSRFTAVNNTTRHQAAYQKAQAKSNRTRPEIELHPALNSISDETKLQKLRLTINDKESTNQQKNIAQKQLNTINDLNKWLHFNDTH